MKKRQFLKDLKEVLSYFKDSKSTIIVFFLLDAIMSFTDNIFSLFFTMAIALFTTNKTLALVLLSINLSSPAISRIFRIIKSKVDTKIGGISRINNINFTNNILFKVRGKVEFEENNVKQTMPENVILDRASYHFDFFKSFIGNTIGLVIQLITFIITFVAICNTIEEDYIQIFTIILAIYIPCIILWNIFNAIYYNKKHDILFREYRKNATYGRDMREIEPISKKHFECMKEKCIISEKKNIRVNYSLEKMRNIKSLFLEGIIIVAGLFLFFRFIITKDIESVTIADLMYCVSIVTLLQKLASSINNYISSIFSYVERIIDYKKNNEDYSQIRKVLESERNLEEFRGDIINIDKFEFNYEDEETSFSLSSKKKLSFEKGKIILLDGKSGAGKSTLIKLISGSLGEVQDSKVKTMAYFDDSTDIGRDTLIKEITLVIDEKDIDYIKLDEILIGVKLKDTLTSERLENEHRDKLSNGERQRVLLARALYNLEDADLVVIDEPIGALDKDSARQVIQFIKEYCNRDKKRIIIICSHQHEFIEDFIDKKYSIRKTGNKSIIE